MGQRSLTSHQDSYVHKSLIKSANAPKISNYFSTSSVTMSTTTHSEQVIHIDSTSTQDETSTSFQTQSTMESSRNLTSGSSSYFFNKRQVIAAEIKWCLNIIHNRMAVNSCTDISALFRSMFPDSSIAKCFSLGKTKCSYLVNHGIAKFFNKRLIEDIHLCSDFVICFDEA